MPKKTSGKPFKDSSSMKKAKFSILKFIKFFRACEPKLFLKQKLDVDKFSTPTRTSI